MFFCFFLLFDYSLDSKSKSHRLQLTIADKEIISYWGR